MSMTAMSPPDQSILSRKEEIIEAGLRGINQPVSGSSATKPVWES